MAEPTALAALLSGLTGRVLEDAAAAIGDLSLEELHVRPGAACNSIGFDVWHLVRTADNLIFFAFERERPVWLQQGLDAAWGLPKADQGTGMAAAEAQALRFPGAEALAGYCRDVASAVRPRIASMSDASLGETTRIKPQGEMARGAIIGQVIVAHGSAHLGQVNLARTLLGRPGLGI